MLPSLTLALLALLGSAHPEGVEQALRRLDAPKASERAAAERWLGAHLAPDDLVQVATAAANSGPEALRRLSAALGSDERHFDLVALLLADSQLAARSLGESSMLRLVSDWLGDAGLEPASSLAVLQALIDGRQQEYRWKPRAGHFEEVVEELVLGTTRHRSSEPGFERIEVVLNPRLSGARFDPLAGGEASGEVRPPPVIEDEAINLLFHASLVQGVAVEGFALGRSERARPWLHLVPQDQVGRRRADELIVEWVRAVLDEGDAQRARAGARALGSCGWGAALAWLERRWSGRNDANAMEGVLLAAGRGRVAPMLLQPARVDALLGEADAALAAQDRIGRARAPLITHALANLPPLGLGRAELSERVARGWSGMGPRRRLLRTAILAGMGRAPSAWRDGLRAELASGSGPSSLAQVWTGARALAATEVRPASVPWTELADFGRLLDLAQRKAVADRFVEALAAARLRPPAPLRDPASLPASWGSLERALTLEAWLRAGEPEVAAAHLGALAGLALGPNALAAAERLRAAAPPGWLQAQLELPPDAGPDHGGLRLATLTGVLPAGRHVELMRALEGSGGVAAEDLGLLGALASGPAGERARELLTAAIRKDVEGLPWEQAFERAHADLSAAGRDEEAAKFLRSIRSPLRRSSHPRRTDLMRRRWPRAPGAAPFPLEALEVGL